MVDLEKLLNDSKTFCSSSTDELRLTVLIAIAERLEVIGNALAEQNERDGNRALQEVYKGVEE